MDKEDQKPKKDNTKCQEGGTETGTLIHGWENVKWYSFFEKHVTQQFHYYIYTQEKCEYMSI